MASVWKLLYLIYVTSFISAGYAVGLAWFGLSPIVSADGWSFHYRCSIVATAFCVSVGIPAIYMIVRPVGKALDLLRSGREADSPVVAAGVKRALNLPVILWITLFMLWVFPAVIFPAAGAVFGFPSGKGPVLITFIGIIGIGSLHATLFLYVTEWFCFRKFLPPLLTARAMWDVPGITIISVREKIVLLFITTSLFPLFDYTVMIGLGTAGLGSALYLSITMLIFGFVQIALILLSLKRPPDRLLRGRIKGRVPGL